MEYYHISQRNFHEGIIGLYRTFHKGTPDECLFLSEAVEKCNYGILKVTGTSYPPDYPIDEGLRYENGFLPPEEEDA